MVELYGTRSCPYTAELREHLWWTGTDFTEYDVQTDSAAKARLAALTSIRTVPVLVKDGKITQIGWQGRGCVAGDP
ncbi:MAG: glutathione S-transferase N-terminal domain-containing protein [Thermaerobacter sp.]|nr:glutathione S-transferase N-terminal domain-containing protein [Thermaerobacter sp.]